MTLRPLAAAVALTSALALSACSSDDPDPVVADPTPSAPSSSADPTPSEDSAEPWEEKTPAGAEAFMDHWVEVFNTSFQGGDARPLRELATKDCDSCEPFADLIDSTYEGGGEIRGGGWTIATLTRSARSKTADETVTVTFKQPRMTVAPAGGEPQTSPAQKSTYVFDLDWAGGWAVSQMVLL
ncbi:DUF6318 family protein [Nocardioides bruguierae]|uniref:DUF6318 family protein n=1 Tax=Nocardioides bruguierae TaxID=2945102 RepID=A0A9X2IG05_9ACTN|nr:DUF6318 family protein [Nocardioides bruguierae]MCM0621862.1 DUF6318 family protein [Nocardioides bruguierae]